ncbi:hypothetical protein NWP21_03590 [Anabaenopsis sp. FSS-46]|uniref:beta strand repeat-containing protein n=1 Tax=Anabaenopsis sp. FSS-46 TaxID=2971766 RepID=UPI002475E0EA|nr:hypothetical protein [Anabaenopsis sp. FSS-46]MDH6097942.1 hypothetical protein [Anabaenopsis sp. FSS-46]
MVNRLERARTETNKSRVQERYVALLGRAPDPASLNGYVDQLNNGTSPEDITQQILDLVDVQDEYGGLTGNQAVTTIYRNAFDTAPPAADLTTLAGQWATNPVSVVTEIVNSPNPSLQRVLGNKVSVAKVVTETVGTELVLTPGNIATTLTGTPGDDVFIGDANSVSATHRLIGGSGTDTFQYYNGGNVLPRLQGVEKVELINANTFNSIDFSATPSLSGLKEVTLKFNPQSTFVDIAGLRDIRLGIDNVTNRFVAAGFGNGSDGNISLVDSRLNTLSIEGSRVNTVNIGLKSEFSATDNRIETLDFSGTRDFSGRSLLSTITISGDNTPNGDAGLTVTNPINLLGKNVTINASNTRGNLTFTLGSGAVNYTGGSGIDNIRLFNPTGNSTFSGGAGNDVLLVNNNLGTTFSHTLQGDAGNDTLTVNGDGSHTLSGGDGGDTLKVNGDGNHRLSGDAGNDTLTVGTVERRTNGTFDFISFDFRLKADGDHTLDGGAGRDELIVYGDGVHTLSGGDGDDGLIVDGNNPSVDPNIRTILQGGAGNDTLLVRGNANYELLGDSGDDTLTVNGTGSHTLRGGAGNDTIILEDTALKDLNSSDIIDGGEGEDRLVLRGSNNSAPAQDITLVAGQLAVAPINAAQNLEILRLEAANKVYTVNAAVINSLTRYEFDVNGGGTVNFRNGNGDQLTLDGPDRFENPPLIPANLNLLGTAPQNPIALTLQNVQTLNLTSNTNTSNEITSLQWIVTDPITTGLTINIVENLFGNDNFDNRSIITGAGAKVTGTNVGFTGEAGEQGQSGDTNSAWWSWTAPASGNVTIDTIGSVDFNTFLSVYTGNALNALTLVGQNDDIDGTPQSRVTFNATAGTTYQIAVDGFLGNTGDIVLNVSQNGAETVPQITGLQIAEPELSGPISTNGITFDATTFGSTLTANGTVLKDRFIFNASEFFDNQGRFTGRDGDDTLELRDNSINATVAAAIERINTNATSIEVLHLVGANSVDLDARLQNINRFVLDTPRATILGANAQDQFTLTNGVNTLIVEGDQPTRDQTVGLVLEGNNRTLALEAQQGTAPARGTHTIDEIQATGDLILIVSGNNNLTVQAPVLTRVNLNDPQPSVQINGTDLTGNLVATGTAGDDFLIGGAGADTLNGGAGADSLEGGAGNDILNGGAGDDILIGGDGADRLTGGAGVNTFVYTSTADSAARTLGSFVNSPDRTFDIITDFKAGLSGDKIDVRGLGYTAAISLQPIIETIGEVAFNRSLIDRLATSALEDNQLGYFRLFQQDNQNNNMLSPFTYVYGRVGDNTTTTDDFLIRLDGNLASTLTAENFIF